MRGNVEEPVCRPKGFDDTTVFENVDANPIGKATILSFAMRALSSEGIKEYVPDHVAALATALMMTVFAGVVDWGIAFSDAVFVGSAYMLPSITADETPAEILWLEMMIWLPGAIV